MGRPDDFPFCGEATVPSSLSLMSLRSKFAPMLMRSLVFGLFMIDGQLAEL